MFEENNYYVFCSNNNYHLDTLKKSKYIFFNQFKNIINIITKIIHL